ncbi:MAG TPA: glutamate--tRNA ligase [Vicinamibacterales bacterium]|nr:glutamate--tRNA ligase [Vicinamibacterales bacterium]
MSRVRVRFAPSPTGRLHVGNARTALFNWLLARRHDGVFVLRIEDTDAERSTLESERSILDDLRWLGLDWDEGPDVGGGYGPYRQSERLDWYAEAAARLTAAGQAYPCFCSPATLEAERTAALAAGAAPKYSGRCRRIRPDEAAARIAAGAPAAIRFAVPDAREVSFDDVVRGRVTFHTDVIGDPVIVRSEGRPAYNFAVVVDDAAMAITHVVRGEDHISNTPRQVLLYEALGAVPPTFAHLSLVMGPDHAPLSKRHGAASVGEFRDRGYLPEALVNYLALLGWSPGDDEELVPVPTMANRFDLARVSHSAAVFDFAKLAWMNRHYMTVAAPDRLARLAMPYFVQAGFVSGDTPAALAFVASLVPMVVGSVDRIDEIPGRVGFLFAWDPAAAARLTAAEPEGAVAVAAMAREVVAAGPLDRDGFRAAAARVRQTTGLKGRALFHPLRVALTAADSGPELDLAVPAIDRGAQLPPGSGVTTIKSCAARLTAVARSLTSEP